MDKSKIIAQNLFGLGVLDKEQTLPDLKLLSRVLKGGLGKILKNPLITKSKKKAIVSKIFLNLVDDGSLLSFEYLIEEDQWQNIDLIVKKYGDLLKNKGNLRLATIETATPLRPELREELTKALENKLKTKITIEEKMRPEILGGARIVVDDMVFDNSILGQIEELKNKLVG